MVRRGRASLISTREVAIPSLTTLDLRGFGLGVAVLRMDLSCDAVIPCAACR